MAYTQKALEIMGHIQKNYPKLGKFYQDTLGNFQMTREELLGNLEDVLSWLEEFGHYMLLFQNDNYYLTDFLD